MADILEDNYQVAKDFQQGELDKAREKYLAEQFEEDALAKLGGSLCFVTRGKTFVWTGKNTDESNSKFGTFRTAAIRN